MISKGYYRSFRGFSRYSGFTLVELLVVLVVLIIVSSLLIPAIFDSMESSREASSAALAHSLNQAMDRVRLSTPQNNGTNNVGLPPELVSTNVSLAVEWLYSNGYLR